MKLSDLPKPKIFKRYISSKVIKFQLLNYNINDEIEFHFKKRNNTLYAMIPALFPEQDNITKEIKGFLLISGSAKDSFEKCYNNKYQKMSCQFNNKNKEYIFTSLNDNWEIDIFN